MNQVEKDSHLIEYELIRKKVKNTTLRITSDGIIQVTANNRIPVSDIEKFLLSKKDWIDDTRKKVVSKHKLYLEHNFIEDGWVELLGEKYNIKVVPMDISTEQVYQIRRKITIRKDDSCIYINKYGDYSNTELEDKLNQWWNGLTKEILEQSLQRVYSLFKSEIIPYPVMKFRRMLTRWGTCTMGKDTITINPILVHLPIELIDYVMAHELTHFLHGDHSSRFYQALEHVMPEHKILQKKLKNYTIIKSKDIKEIHKRDS